MSEVRIVVVDEKKICREAFALYEGWTMRIEVDGKETFHVTNPPKKKAKVKKQ